MATNNHTDGIPRVAQTPLTLTGKFDPLVRGAQASLVEQLANRYAERIGQRLLAAGHRLPSVRAAAQQHRVSPSTVVAAYDQLLARGLVESKPHRGFFVRQAQSSPAALAPREAQAPAERPKPLIDATALMRGMFHADTRASAPGIGVLPAAWLDLPLLHGALRRAMKSELAHVGSDRASAPTSLHYGDPLGNLHLRQSLALMLMRFGVQAQPSQIITTVGATHALDVVTRSLLRPGDAVLVDEPGWAVEFARLAHQGLKLLPVPRQIDGPDLATLGALMREHRPRLYSTVSVLHNPTGGNLSLARAHQVLKLAEAYDVLIVEDDTYAHLADAHLPRLSALDGLRRTLHVSGFSKILAPGWRVGHVAAPAHLVDRLVEGKMLSSLTSPSLIEQAVSHAIDSGALMRHAERVTRQLSAARDRVQRLAREHALRFVSPPQGLFGWVDTGVDTERLSQRLLDEDWLTAPGRLFHVSGKPSTLMRLNFAASQDAKFWKAFVKARQSLLR
jgi:DNA-binding transcriptional MocR family regulator